MPPCSHKYELTALVLSQLVFMNIAVKVLAVSFLSCGSFVALSQPSGYTYGKRITIDNNEVAGSTALVDFPFLLNLIDADLRSVSNGGQLESESGYDLIFTLADISQVLDHELEKYDPTSGELVVWIKIPSLSASVDTDILMFYGNASVSSDPSTESVWDNGFVAVWHLAQDPTAPGPQIDDSTSNNFHASSSGSMDSSDLVGGQIGDAVDFDGSDDLITHADDPQLDIGTDDLTISCWVNVDNTNNGDKKEILNKKGGGSGNAGYAIRIKGDEVELAHKVSGQGNTNVSSSSSITLTAGTWHYVAVVFDVSADEALIHVDGVAEPSISINAGNSLDNTEKLTLGQRQNGSSNEMDGKLDEARVANVARSTDWLLTEYNNQSDPSGFFSLSLEMPAAVLVALLPVVRTDFHLTLTSNSAVEICWTTLSESNSDVFQIERSRDGMSWSLLGEIAGAGNSSQPIHYEHTDNHPLLGRSFYRIRQVDQNGDATLSELRSVVVGIEDQPPVVAYLNPTRHKVYLECGSFEFESIRVVSMFGRELTSEVQVTGHGSWRELDVSRLLPGTYLVCTRSHVVQISKW